MGRYTSTGTVKVRRCWRTGDTGKAKFGAGETTMLFVPDGNHSVRHGGHSYAVFVDLGERKDTDQSGTDGALAFVSKLDSRKGNGIPLRVEGVGSAVPADLYNALYQAATAQCIVDVEVEMTKGKGSEVSIGDINLVGVTIPTPNPTP